MIKVSVDVYSGAARFRAAVWAENIEHALNLTGMRYPGCEAKVVFPIDAETFFIEGPAPPSGTIVLGAPEEMAG